MQVRAAEPRKFLKHACSVFADTAELSHTFLRGYRPLEPRKISYTYHRKLSGSWEHISHLIRLDAVTAFWPVFPTSLTSAWSRDIVVEHGHFEYSEQSAEVRTE